MKNSLKTVLIILGFTASCGIKKPISNNSINLGSSDKLTNQLDQSDSIYISVRKEVDTKYTTEFNNKVIAVDAHIYKVYVSGVDIHINTNSALWLALANGSVSELNIEGDTVTIESKISFPNTKLSIVTKKLKVLPGSNIDLTPSGYTVSFDSVGVDGSQGLPGPEFNILADNIEIQSQEPVFISKGGPGQNAGPGKDGLAGSVVPPWGSKPDEIGMEQYDYHKTNWCWGNGWKFKCGSTDTHWDARGTFIWPSDGENATVAGAPGAGGQGGFVYIQTQSSNVSLEQFINVDVGINGPKGKDYTGGVSGTPVTAHIVRVSDNGSDHSAQWDDMHTAKAGVDAIAPTIPRSVNAAGQIKVDTINQHVHFKQSYFEKKLQWIRDLYISGDGEAVSRELNETLTRLSESMPADSDDDIRWVNLQSKLQVLRMYLSLQRNYFGKEQSEAPFYNLDIDIDHFKELIKSSMQIIYLESVLSDETVNRQQKVDLLKQWITQAKADIEKSIQSQTGNRLINEGLSLKMQNLAKQQKAFEDQVIQVQKNLEQSAKSNVEFNKTLKESAQNFKVLLTLAKVFPAGQPALAAVASLAEKVSQTPKDGSVADWIDYASNANEAFEKYDKIDSSSMKDDLEAYAAKLKTEGKSDDEIKKDLKDLYKETKPFYEALKKQQDIIKGSAVSNNEINAEFKRLMSIDPLYIDLVSRVKAIQASRTQIAIQLSTNANEYQEILRKLTASIILQAQSANLLIESSDTLNPEFMSLMSHLSMDAQDRLLYYYNAIEKSYEYVTLEPAQAQLHLGYIVAKVREILRNRPLNERLDALTQTYSMAANTLIQELNKYIETKNKPSVVHTATIKYTISQKEVNELNNGETHVLLDESLFPNEKNLRITNIEILAPNLKDKPRGSKIAPNDPDNGSMIKFKVILDSDGIIKDFANKSHYYTYRGYDQLYTWIARTQIDKKISHEQNPVDHSVTQWLALILGKNATDLANSSLFASHAALTGLKIQTEKFGQGQNYNIKGLQLKITYSFYETAN